MKALEVVDWHETFENHRSREIRRLSYVQIPNTHDGESYQQLMATDDAAELFAAWILLIQVASRCKVRGILLKDGGKPHDSVSLAARTHGKAAWFDKLIPVALKLGWLRWRTIPRNFWSENHEFPKDSNVISRPGAGIPRHAAGTSRAPRGTPRRSAAPARRQKKEGKTEDSLSVCLSGGGGARLERGAPRAASVSENGATPPARPTLEQVQSLAAAEGIDPDAANAFHRHFEEVGWTDARGEPLRSWRARLRYWWQDWERRTKSPPNGDHGGPTRAKEPPAKKKTGPAPPPPKPLAELLAQDPKAAEILKAEVSRMRQAAA